MTCSRRWCAPTRRAECQHYITYMRSAEDVAFRFAKISRRADDTSHLIYTARAKSAAASEEAMNYFENVNTRHTIILFAAAVDAYI